MDSKTQVKKTSVTGGTGCKQPGKKKAKERKSSRLYVYIYSAGGKSSSCHKLVHNYDEVGTSNIGSMVSESRSESFDTIPLHFKGSILVPPVGLGDVTFSAR
ncbi:hypothetical protein AVEN_71480-1 [Araneus ventricosus]|uniref:Uncharacterized protein n=2 Tax=Araneus ventricosus TaxID=182803 RepID=A0A4Y2CWE6_ARAVE|nr:hypothetical protein AVEN_71480-1 [Araneus ventricosus]